MKNKKRCSDNSNLFITQDLYEENVFFVRTEAEQFARIKKNDKWVFFIYPYKMKLETDSLTLGLEAIDKLFKEYWEDKYAKKQ